VALSTAGEHRRGRTLGRVALVLALLYLFLAGVKGLESGINNFGADFTDRLFQSVSNPLAGLFVGVLATVLVQSSSVTTSTIVGLVGTGTLSVAAAVPMVMGANIGTTVTNTIVSLAHVRRSEEFRRAFASATMHDFFNVLAVVVLLPLELITGFLSRSAAAIAQVVRGRFDVGAAPNSPIKSAVRAPAELLEEVLRRLDVDEVVTGVILLIGGVALILGSLAFITRTMRALLAGRIERSINTVLAGGAGLAAMAVGMIVTVAVQSSSITTSMLIPLVAAGVLTLANAYPITLGANLGTTVTALLASLVATGPGALVVALTHTLFNLTGIAIFYPVPKLRRVPLVLAQRLASLAVHRRSLALAYVLIGFIVIPLAGILLLQ
jgi:sodium-dependent phosphate cotransporter